MLNIILPLIQNLRRNIDVENNWRKLHEIIETNIHDICKTLNTRWLISICDTYIDYGSAIESRNAMMIVLIVNMEKLAQTNLFMYDLNINKNKLKKLKTEKPFELWDGMTSFNLAKGNMTKNLFKRLNKLIEDTPVIEKIYYTVLERIKNNDTILANLNKHHKRLFEIN